MPLVDVARALQQVEALAQPSEEGGRREELRARGGELEREWKTVEARTEVRDRGVLSEVGPDSMRSFEEERHRLVLGEWREVELDLPLDAKRLAARRQHP